MAKIESEFITNVWRSLTVCHYVQILPNLHRDGKEKAFFSVSSDTESQRLEIVIPQQSGVQINNAHNTSGVESEAMQCDMIG